MMGEERAPTSHHARSRRKEEAIVRLRASGASERLRQQLLVDLLTDQLWLENIKDELKQSEEKVMDLSYKELLAKVVPLAKSFAPAATKAICLKRSKRLWTRMWFSTKLEERIVSYKIVFIMKVTAMHNYYFAIT